MDEEEPASEAMMEKLIAEEIVRKLVADFGLAPHPEGGFFAETFRSALVLPLSNTSQRLVASTAIYFLVLQKNVSRLHRIKYDEVWHFYLGGPLVVVELVDGGYRETVLGQNIFEAERVQHVVRGGTWFGCFPKPGTYFSFVGCTVAPGFEFRDFELGDRAKLTAEFPAARDVIEKLT